MLAFSCFITCLALPFVWTCLATIVLIVLVLCHLVWLSLFCLHLCYVHAYVFVCLFVLSSLAPTYDFVWVYTRPFTWNPKSLCGTLLDVTFVARTPTCSFAILFDFFPCLLVLCVCLVLYLFLCFLLCLSAVFVFFCCCMYTLGARASLLKMQLQEDTSLKMAMFNRLGGLAS